MVRKAQPTDGQTQGVIYSNYQFYFATLATIWSVKVRLLVGLFVCWLVCFPVLFGDDTVTIPWINSGIEK